MIITENTFNGRTEVDLTNFEHPYPYLTLVRSTNPRDLEYETNRYIIENYKTGEVHQWFDSLSDAVIYCNNNFDSNFSYNRV